MSRKSLPLGIMAMILIVALATMGIAYGLWEEKLVIDGTVYTGEVDVGFSGPWPFEWVDVNGSPQMEPDIKDKYAECYAWRWDADPGSDGEEGITVEVVGAYPSYHCWVVFDVSNIGTVPVHVSHPYGEAPPWVQVHACYPPWWQIHRGESVWGSILIHFTNDDKVGENDRYEFHFTIDALQWNEAPPIGGTRTLESTTCSPGGLPAGLELPAGYGQ